MPYIYDHVRNTEKGITFELYNSVIRLVEPVLTSLSSTSFCAQYLVHQITHATLILSKNNIQLAGEHPIQDCIWPTHVTGY